MAVIQKAALIENLTDGEFLQRYSFTRQDGTEGLLELKPAEADRWETFRDRLKNKDAHSSLLTKSTIENAAASQPLKRLAYAAATGWRPGRKTFVLPQRVIGTNTKNICGLPPDPSRPRLRPRGTHEAWLRSVGSLATKSSGMMLTISCAFASPLLRVANEQSFGVCLAGKTGGGKTTATLAASSAFSSGQIDQLPSWNATLAGLEPVLRAHNDCLLIVDDLNKMPVASEKEKHRSAKNFAHNLAAGSIKLRSPAFDQSVENGGQYRVISLTSAETTIAELAARCGEQRGGDARRLIDVPIYFEDLQHVFDRVPDAGKLTQSALQSLYSSVHTACAQNHGHVFTHYVKFLIQSGAGLSEKIAGHVTQFGRHMADKSESIVHTDVIRKFGLIYAGGALAIEGAALPWKNSELLHAIAKCCRVSLETISSEQIILDKGWTSLRTHLKKLPRVDTIEEDQWNSIDGYVEPQADRYRCVVKTDKFNRCFDTSLQRKLVLDRLAERGWLTRSRSQERQEQFTWPDGVRRRSLEINWGRVAGAA